MNHSRFLSGFATFAFIGTLLCVPVPLMGQSKSKPVDPSGTWRWEYEFGGETMKDSVRLQLEKDGKVVGTYHGRSEKPIEIEEGKWDGPQISFRFPMEFQGSKLQFKFSGKIVADELDGMVAISNGDGSQEFPWKPKRSVQSEDLIGEWSFRIETPDGEILEPVLTISKSGEKLVGKYVSKPNISAEIKEIKIVDNQMVFFLQTEVETTPIEATFRGRPFGQKIAGKIEYKIGGDSGEVEFSGKRKSTK